MSKSGVKNLSTVLVVCLVLVLLTTGFASANWFTDIFAKKTGNTITGNVVGGSCSFKVGTSMGTGTSGAVGLTYTTSNGVTYTDIRFLCQDSVFYDCGWELSNSNIVKATNGQVVGGKICTITSSMSGSWSTPCTDSTWTPSTSNTCSNQTLVQTSNCGRTRTVQGTKNCTVVTTTCTDSDGGVNYTVKGVVNSSIGNIIETDKCITYESEYNLEEHFCNTDSNNGLIGLASTTLYSCPNGCSEGSCLPEPAIVYNSSCDNSSCVLYEGQSVNFLNYYVGISYVSPDSIILGIEGVATSHLQVGSFHIVGNLEIKINSISYSTKESVPSKVVFNYRLLPPTCTDSDGGLNYEVKGTTSGALGGENYSSSDICGSKYYQRNILLENFCNGTSEDSVSYDCPFGCYDGACLSEDSQVCPALIDSVKNPISTEERRLSYNDSYSGSAYVDGKQEAYTQYHSAWDWSSSEKLDNQINYYYVTQEIQVFENKEINLSQYADWNKEDVACKSNPYWVDDKENYYYVCNWDVFNNNQDLTNNYQANNRQIFWYNNNVLIRLYLYWGNELTDSQVQKLMQQKVGDLLNTLQNNDYEYIDWTNFDIPSPVEEELSSTMGLCGSDVFYNRSVDQREWNCKTEPVICPEHGYQTRTCQSWNSQTNKYDTQETQISCSPGICSGCYTPKWFESGSGENRCIPYGFRFKQQTGWDLQDVFVNDTDSESLTVAQAQNPDDVNLTVYSNNTALLGLEVKQGVWKEIYLESGKDYDWKNLTGAYDQDNLDYILRVDEIYYDSLNYLDSFIIVSFTMVGYQNQQLPANINAYCDIDGQIKQQKTQAWGECQNNYECESNLCSYGECADIKGTLEQVNKFKLVFVKTICKIAHLLSTENYDQCVANYDA